MFNGDGKMPNSGSNLSVGNEAVQFHEYIPYGLGTMSVALHYMDLGKGAISKTELARVVYLVPGTTSRFDLAICGFSWIHSIKFRSYKQANT